MKVLWLAAALLFVFAEGASAQNWWVCVKRYKVVGVSHSGEIVRRCPVCTEVIYTERADEGAPGKNCRWFRFRQEADTYFQRRCCP
jgi:hypothetical protein